MKINKKIIKELSDYLDEFNLSELEYTEKDTKIKVSKNKITLNNQNTHSPVIKKTESSNNEQNSLPGKAITSPIIGTAYLAPEPGGKKFIEIGQKIKKGIQIFGSQIHHTMVPYGAMLFLS